MFLVNLFLTNFRGFLAFPLFSQRLQHFQQPCRRVYQNTAIAGKREEHQVILTKLVRKRLTRFKENALLIFFILMGARLLEHSFLEHFGLEQFSVIQGKFYMQRFSNTSFGRTLLGSNFGGLLLEHAFCGHFVAFPPWVLSFTQAHLCDTPFCNISRDICAIPHKSANRGPVRGLPLPLGRGVCETKSKKGRSKHRKSFLHGVYSVQREIETMVADHGLNLGPDHGVWVDPNLLNKKGRSFFLYG